jgi:lipopolysaccharide/colanic/teichoic acid biosynthesis glycosyltransferase
MELVSRTLPRALSSARRRAADRTPDIQKTGRARGRDRTQFPALDEQLFRDIVIRESRRADRFDQSFALVLVASGSRESSEGPWSEVVEALGAVRQDTDVLGWFEGGRVLGLLRTSIVLEPSAAGAMERQIRRELDHRLGSVVAPAVSVSIHVSGVEDPLLEALRVSRDRSQIRNVAKRALDITGSFALIVILSPLLLLIAALVKLTSPGAVFFRQVRIGACGKPFTMLKFRTMREGVNHDLHREYVTQFINRSGGAVVAGDSGLFKIHDDPRVTFTGRILRKTSLDELPQFWNVLRGDMSLVGPRPPISYEVEQYKRWHYRRVLEAKPGITGLWQVTARSRANFDEMVRLDLRYVQTQSFWTDIKILLATPRAVISGKGAC